MKEQTLLEMKNKIDSMTRIIQHLITEITHLRELSVGTLETVKLMDSYEDAIEKLQKSIEDNVKQKQKKKDDGVIKQDTK